MHMPSCRHLSFAVWSALVLSACPNEIETTTFGTPLDGSGTDGADDEGDDDDDDGDGTGSEGASADGDTSADDATDPTIADDTGGDPGCGNGVIEAGEDCDGRDLGLASCASEGFGRGTLACAADCTFDTSGCMASGTEEGTDDGAVPVCGNGMVELGEQCDAADLDGQTCVDFDFTGGTLSCADDCTIDTSNCANEEPICGDNVADAAEDCDGPDFAGQDCVGLGFAGGALSCTGDCMFDTTDCTAGGDSCTGNCGVYDDTASCQCDSACVDFGDCCDDICPQCDGMGGVSCDGGGGDSCTGNCGVYDDTAACQCDSACVDFGDCCGDICPQCDGIDGVAC